MNEPDCTVPCSSFYIHTTTAAFEWPVIDRVLVVGVRSLIVEVDGMLVVLVAVLVVAPLPDDMVVPQSVAVSSQCM